MPNYFHRLIEAGYHRPSLTILWALVAVTLRGAMPWFFWLTVAGLPAWALFRAEKEFFKSPTARKIAFVCVGLLAVHMAWAMVRVTFYNANSSNTYWRDDFHYFHEATAIAEAWKSGYFPDIYLKGSPPFLGTIHTGYHRPLALVFAVAGSTTLAGLFLNAICASLMPMLAALCGRYLWQKDLSKYDKGRGVRSFAWISALLVACQPNQFYWSAYLLKDTFTALVFMATLTVTAGAIRRRDLSLVTALLLLLPFFFTVRAYAALSIFLGLIGFAMLGLPRRRVVQFGVGATVVVFMVCTYTVMGGALYSQLRDSFTSLAPAGWLGPLDALKQIAAGIPRLFLAPYAWLLMEKPTPMWGMYPGMWYLYLVIWPLGLAGVAGAVRNNLRLAVLPLAALGVGALIFLTSSFAGNASRQRYYLEPVFALFAAYGLANQNRWWIGGALIAELAFAVGQVICLK